MDLTAAIVSQLTWLTDIVCCSVVSKTWLAACRELQLHALEIPGDYEGAYKSNQEIDEVSLDSIIRLVQQWHKTGTLRNLTTFSLLLDFGCTEDCSNSGRLPDFIRSILTIAGMWDSLQHCVIHADVDMEVPASLLSSNLQSLELSLRGWKNVKKCMSLSMLHRLSSLRSLWLGPIEWDVCEDAPERFVLQSVFHQLTKLELDYLPLQVSKDFTLSGCLPNLIDLSVCVFPSDAQAVLDLPNLQSLTLKLLCVPSSVKQYARLIVPASSKLHELYVWATSQSSIRLRIQKLDLKFRCKMIEVEYNWPRCRFWP